MIFRSRPRRVICVVCFFCCPLTQKITLRHAITPRTRRYRKRHPHYKKERPHAIIGIENDTQHMRGDSCVNASLPSHSWVSKTIPGRKREQTHTQIVALRFHRYRKRYPSLKRGNSPHHAHIGIENDTRQEKCKEFDENREFNEFTMYIPKLSKLLKFTNFTKKITKNSRLSSLVSRLFAIFVANMKRVNFHTLGCKLNFSESSTLARQFEAGGFVRVGTNEDADISIINSCSVTAQADKKCRNLIRKIHRRNPDTIIAVTGCYAQLKPYEIAEIEGVDIVLSNNDKGETYKQVLQLTERGRTKVFSCETDEITSFFSAFSSGDRTRAFLKVQDGCDYCCSYCTIHNARGASRNTPIAEAVKQAEEIARGGQKEIVITGVNTGDFGRTTGESFLDLLRALNEVEGIERYRISSIEPNLLTDNIIAFCASSPKFQHHFHIPIQCGSNKVLGLMRRRYTVEKFEERINAVRRAMPDAFIGIDVITGFPGEGDAEFEECYNFLSKINPSFLHIFPFSERENTPAVNFPDKVSPEVSMARAKRLEELSSRCHYDFAKRYLGTTAEVLFESTMRGGMMTGFTSNYLKVKVPYDRRYINQILKVELLEIEPSAEILGEIVE